MTIIEKLTLIATFQFSIPSLAGQTARLGSDWKLEEEPSLGFNPLISGADRATVASGSAPDSALYNVSIPSLAGQTARLHAGFNGRFQREY